jgi:O-antigen ligase
VAVRLFAAVGLVVLTLGFVWSGSRGGFIALAAVAIYVVLCFSAIPLRWRLSATALVAVVLIATASDQYWHQMGTIASDADYNHTAESGRLQIWSRGIGYMMDNPVLGVGPGNFQTAEGTLSPFAERQQYGVGVRWNAPHNSFVQIGAELGFPGLALYIAVIASAFSALRRAGDLSPALTASLLGFVVGSFFLSLAYSEMLYTLVALAVGLRKVS